MPVSNSINCTHQSKIDTILVFPGITGKTIQVESFTHDINNVEWKELRKAFSEVLGVSYITGLGSSRMRSWVSARKRNDNTFPFVRHGNFSVVIIDMQVHGIQNSTEFILECRNSLEDINKNIIFVFYHAPNFFEDLSETQISEGVRKRFSHYYVIEKTLDPNKLRRSVRNTWNFVMQDLMRIDSMN